MCEVPLKDIETKTVPQSTNTDVDKPEWEWIPPSTTPSGEDFFN